MKPNLQRTVKNFACLLTIGAALCGCQSNEIQKTIPVEDSSWAVVSTSTETYSIVVDNYTALQDIPLDQLVAVCISGDESIAEGSHDELYQRFTASPFTVCCYLSLIRDDEMLEKLCLDISVAAVCWHQSEERILDVINDLQQYPLSSGEEQVISTLAESYQYIKDGNT